MKSVFSCKNGPLNCQNTNTLYRFPNFKSLFLKINFSTICYDILNKFAISQERNVRFQKFLHHNWDERTAIQEIAKSQFLHKNTVFAPNPSSNLKIKYWRVKICEIWKSTLRLYFQIFWLYIPITQKSSLPTTDTFRYVESQMKLTEHFGIELCVNWY